MHADFNPLGLVIVLGVLALVYFFRRREATSVCSGFRAMGSMDAHVVGLSKVVGTIGPATITYVIVQGGKSSPGSTTLTTPTPTGMPPFEMHLRSQGASDARLVERGLEIDIRVGDPVFDAAVVIEAAPADLACAALDPQTRALVMQAMPCTLDVADGVLRLYKRGKVTNPSAAGALLAALVQVRAALSTLRGGFTTNDAELAQLHAVRARRMGRSRMLDFALRGLFFVVFVGGLAYSYFNARRHASTSHGAASNKTSTASAQPHTQAASTGALSASDAAAADAAAREFRFGDGSYPGADVDDPQKKLLTDHPALLHYLASRKDDPKARAGALYLIAYQRKLDPEALRTLTEHLRDPGENDGVVANLASAASVVETPDANFDEALRTVCRTHARAVVRGLACIALAHRHRPLPASADDANTAALVGACGDEAIVLQELEGTFYAPVPDIVFDAALRRVGAKEPEAVRFYALQLLELWANGGLTPQQIDRLAGAVTPALSDAHPALRAAAANALVAPPGRWRVVQRVLPLLSDAAKPKLSMTYEAVTFEGPVQRTQEDSAGGSVAYVTDDDADAVWKVVTDAVVSKGCGDVDEIGTAERWDVPTTRTHATFLAAWRSWYARNVSHLPMDGPGGG